MKEKKSSLTIEKLSAYQIAIPLTTPYHLSKVYGTQTHCDAVIIRLETTDGSIGWGEADPGGLIFSGDTGEMVMTSLRESEAQQVLGKNAEEWIEQGPNPCRGDPAGLGLGGWMLPQVNFCL